MRGAKKEEKSRELAVVKPAVLATSDELGELGKITAPRMPKIEVMHGSGGFKIPARGEEAEPQEVESFNGIVIDIVSQKIMYLENFNERETGKAPDCMAIDGGAPNHGREPVKWNGETVQAFGNCETCFFNKFGSGTGQGKACKDGWAAYVLIEGYPIPGRMKLPITSKSSVEGWVARLRSMRTLPRMVVTKFTTVRHPKRNTVSIVLLSVVSGVERHFYTDVVAPFHEGLKDFVRTPRAIELDVPEQAEPVAKPRTASRRGPKGAEI